MNTDKTFLVSPNGRIHAGTGATGAVCNQRIRGDWITVEAPDARTVAVALDRPACRACFDHHDELRAARAAENHDIQRSA